MNGRASPQSAPFTFRREAKIGSFCRTPEPTPIPTTTTTVNEIPTWISAPATRNINASEQIANQDYRSYGGPRLAGVNPLQQPAFGTVQNMQGSWMPSQNNAMNLTGQASAGFPGVNLSSYMNPYQQGVTDIAKREAIRDSDISGRGLDAQAARSGAFGGSRHGLIQAERERNLGQRLTDIQTAGGSQAFQQAAQLSQQDLNRQLAAGKQFGELGATGQQNYLRDIAALQGAGDTQQQQSQRELDIPYQEFLAQREYPKQQATWLNSIIRGTPYGTSQTQQGQQFTPQSSPLSQAAGLGITGLGLYGMTRGLFG